MSRFVRPSKYRHVYGQGSKKEQCFENIKVSANAFDTNLVSVNPLFFSINWQAGGGGAFAVVPLNHTGKLPDVYSLCRAHTGAVLDTAWNPFDDYIVASGGEDSKVALTKINPDYLETAWNPEVETQDLTPMPNIGFSHGGKKVGNLNWHPTASNVLASAAADIKLWDLNAQKAGAELNAHPDIVQSFAFNHTGNLLASTCKDKKLRVFDVRASKDPISIGDSHSGVKGSRVIWAGNLDRLITTGFSRMSDRQCAIWNSGSLDKPIKQITVDTSSGMLMPFFSDNNVLFLAGKGDGNIRYYEYDNDELHFLSEYKSNDPQRGMNFMPRRGLNVSDCEIARAFKVSGSGVDPISFIVPRKSDAFQGDIYPPAPAPEPSMTAAEFFSGKTTEPVYMDLNSKQKTDAPPAPTPAASTPQTPAKTPPTSSEMASETARSSFPPNPVSAAEEPPVQTLASSSSPEDMGKQAQAKASTGDPAEAPTPASVKSAAREPAPSSSPAPAPAAPTPAPASTSAGAGADDAQVDSLRDQVSKLESQLSERDSIIRTLELKVEKLAGIHKNAQQAFATV